MLRDELEELSQNERVNVVHILSDGSLDDDLHNGRINASKTMLLMQTVDTALPTKVLLSGPKSMKQEVRRGLDLCRVPEADIRTEDFHHPPHLEAPVTSTCEVTAEYQGKTVSFTYEPGEETLMDAVLHHGLDAPQSCRGGVCGSCRAVVLEGEVSEEHSYALTAAERAQGMVLCCQSRPAGSKVSLSFKEGQ